VNLHQTPPWSWTGYSGCWRIWSF